MVGQSYFTFLTQTNWVSDPETQFNYSWLIEGVIEIMIIINMIHILKLTYHALKLNYIWVRNRIYSSVYCKKIRKRYHDFTKEKNKTTKPAEV